FEVCSTCRVDESEEPRPVYGGLPRLALLEFGQDVLFRSSRVVHTASSQRTVPGCARGRRPAVAPSRPEPEGGEQREHNGQQCEDAVKGDDRDGESLLGGRVARVLSGVRTASAQPLEEHRRT